MKTQIKFIMQNQLEITQFHVQKPITSLLVSVVMEREVAAYIQIYNPNNLLCGWIGNGVSNFLKECYLSDERCTLNSLSHELVEGTYTVVIFSFAPIERKQVELLLNIEQNVVKEYEACYAQDLKLYKSPDFDEITEAMHRYYKGDFHGHTIFSDGHNSCVEANEMLEQQKLDFMAFTEHNSMPLTQKKMPCLLIPSFELTLPLGHMNVHGVKEIGTLCAKIQNYGIVNGKVGESEISKKIWDIVVDYYAEEANLSLNHMFMEPWHFTYDEFDFSKLNTIEIICDPTYPTAQEANDKAVAFLDFLWEEGLNIYGIGGSDSHNKKEERYEGAVEPSLYGDPATYVFAKGLSVRNIVEAVKAGHSYVARYVTMDISICGSNDSCRNSYLPGDEITEDESISYTVEVKSMENTDRELVGCFILNNQIVKTVPLNKSQGQIPSKVEFVMEQNTDSWWLRFGVYDNEKHVIAYVNPIYQNRKKGNALPFKIVKEKFGEHNDKRDFV